MLRSDSRPGDHAAIIPGARTTLFIAIAMVAAGRYNIADGNTTRYNSLPRTAIFTFRRRTFRN